MTKAGTQNCLSRQCGTTIVKIGTEDGPTAILAAGGCGGAGRNTLSPVHHLDHSTGSFVPFCDSSGGSSSSSGSSEPFSPCWNDNFEFGANSASNSSSRPTPQLQNNNQHHHPLTTLTTLHDLSGSSKASDMQEGSVSAQVNCGE